MTAPSYGLLTPADATAVRGPNTAPTSGLLAQLSAAINDPRGLLGNIQTPPGTLQGTFPAWIGEPEGAVETGLQKLAAQGSKAKTPWIGADMTPEIAERILKSEGKPAVVDDAGKLWSNGGASHMAHGDLKQMATEGQGASFENGNDHHGWFLDGKFVSTADLQRMFAPGQAP